MSDPFEEHRAHLRAVAYRMLGSTSDADDAVQEGWIRMSRTDVSGVASLRAWLTTVVARVCLDMLRTRASRREDSLDTHVPDPVIARFPVSLETGPEAEAILADSVGLALLVVLETLEPAERRRACRAWCAARTRSPHRPHRSREPPGCPRRWVLVNGSVGVVSRLPDGRVLSVIGFTIAGGRVVRMDILADPDRLGRLDLSAGAS